MVSAESAVGYAYALPGGWLHLDVRADQVGGSVRRALAQRVRREPRLAPHLGTLDRLLRHECAVAAACGAQRVSLFAEPAGGRVMTAAVTFAIETPRGQDARGPLDAAAILTLLAEPGDPGADEVGELALLELAQVELAQGRGVRRTWIEDGGRVSAVPLTTRQWQLIVPWPAGPQVGLLTMSSPCQPLWPQLDEIFDACGQSFRWTRSD